MVKNAERGVESSYRRRVLSIFSVFTMSAPFFAGAFFLSGWAPSVEFRLRTAPGSCRSESFVPFSNISLRAALTLTEHSIIAN